MPPPMHLRRTTFLPAKSRVFVCPLSSRLLVLARNGARRPDRFVKKNRICLSVINTSAGAGSERRSTARQISQKEKNLSVCHQHVRWCWQNKKNRICLSVVNTSAVEQICHHGQMVLSCRGVCMWFSMQSYIDVVRFILRRCEHVHLFYTRATAKFQTHHGRPRHNIATTKGNFPSDDFKGKTTIRRAVIDNIEALPE